MPRFRFDCAYDGAPYLGWQSQRGGNTVQDALETAFAAILKAPLRIHGAGRTDAGVHAWCQTFHADLPEGCRLDACAWRAALNAHLPASIRITGVWAVCDAFHARFSAEGKLYEYTICTDEVLPPFLVGRAWHHPRPLDDALLQRALKLYVGRHDFRHFAARRGNEPAVPPADFYKRSLWSARVKREGELLRLRYHGEGFMYRMVRLLTGTACQVATGRLPLESLAAMLDTEEGETSRYCAPAGGLSLVRVEYSVLDRLLADCCSPPAHLRGLQEEGGQTPPEQLES